MTAQDKALKENTASAPLQIVAPGTCVETGEQAEIIQESRIDSILNPGTRVRLTLNAVKANAFDRESGRSLMRGVHNELEVDA